METEFQTDPLEADSSDVPVYVIFSREVNQPNALNLVEKMSELANANVDEVHLLITSPGGGVDQGFNLYNLLKAMPFKLVTHATGTVASAAVNVYLAGEERLAAPSSAFMLHGISATFPADVGQSIKQLKERHDAMLANEARTNGIIAERTSMTKRELGKFSETERRMNAKEAVSVGVAHKVEHVAVPREAFIVHI